MPGLAGHLADGVSDFLHGLAAFFLYERLERLGVEVCVALGHGVETVNERCGVGLSALTLGVRVAKLRRGSLNVADLLHRRGLEIVHVGVGVFVHAVALAGLGDHKVEAVFVTADLLDEGVRSVLNSGVLLEVLIVHLAEAHALERRSRFGVTVSQPVTQRRVAVLVLGANAHTAAFQFSGSHLAHFGVSLRVVGDLRQRLL